MADYIYLLQNRLTPPQWRALEAVREAARAQAMPVFLVGGAVRDLTSGSPVRDLDFAVQGEASSVLGDLEGRGASLAGRNELTGAVYLTFRGGVRAEISPTLTVRYPKPGQPEVQTAVILDDLRRRDFTANAMAVSLNEGSYGLLLDPLNGTADIENRELRLVSPYGFIEQPALLLRAARLGERLGWSLEEKTQTRYDNSKEEGHIQALPAADRGYELEEIFHEEDPMAVMEHMTAEGWRDTLFSALQPKDADTGAVDAMREQLGLMESQGLHPDPSAVLFPLVTAKMSEANRAALKKLFARQGFVQQVESLEARAKDLAAQITSKAMAQPSDTWKLLMDADPEALLWLGYHSRSSAAQAKIKAFLKDWPPMRQRIPYAMMQEMRITPDLPGYDKLLDDLFFALIDGKLDTPEATRAFLEPHSPPAPPQVAVRRRAAKAARGRTKRVKEEAVLDRSDDEEPEDSGAGDGDAERRGDEPEDADEDEEEEDSESSNTSASPKKHPSHEESEALPSPAKVLKSADAPVASAPGEDASAAPQGRTTVSKGVANKAVAKKVPSEVAPAPQQDEEELERKRPAVKVATAPTKQAVALAPASPKKQTAASTATNSSSAKATSAPKKDAPAKADPPKVSAKPGAPQGAVGQTAGAKVAATAAKANAAAKKSVPPTPAKAAKSAPPAKAAAQKQAAPPLKVVAKKAVPAGKAPAKGAPAKKAAPKILSVSRKAPPVKAAKKVPAKGKARR